MRTNDTERGDNRKHPANNQANLRRHDHCSSTTSTRHHRIADNHAGTVLQSVVTHGHQ